MRVQTRSEASRLRALLGDVLALSALPTLWIGNEPPAVAAGLADAIVGLAQLDFIFVRLCDPGGAAGAEVTRGDAWNGFPQWLENHLATSVHFRKEIVPDAGSGSETCHGIAIPIGVNGQGGVLAAACKRSDFPNETDQLLLSLAANQAATAFQSARLIQERQIAEEELREARGELERKVAERTAELGRSEAYLAEAQRLTHNGSFAIDATTQEPTHSSDEHSRLYGFDPEQGIPSLSEFLQRIHPEDRAICTEALERGIRDATDFEVEYRVILPRGPVRRVRSNAHPVFNASGKLDEVVGTVVDVTERRQAEADLGRLAGEQAALRRVATVVAREASQAEVFAAIAEEIGQLLGAGEIRMLRYEDDRSGVVVGSSGRAEGVFPIGHRTHLGGDNAASRVFRTGRPARIDDYDTASGPITEYVRSAGIRSVVATPILVEGRLWGAMFTGTTQPEPLPPETECRLGQFTELMATAIANADARAEVERLAQEQAALRRVATLVAQGAPPTAVFDAVATEMEGLLDADRVVLSRYEAGDEFVLLAHRGPEARRAPPGTRMPHEEKSVTATVRRTERPVRMETGESGQGPLELVDALGVPESVGAPIVVDGRLWGVIVASWSGEESPRADTEARMARFAELLDTAIANADTLDKLTASRARLLTAGDEARRRVVRDLHDGAQQRLVHSIVTLKLAQQALRGLDGKAESLVDEALAQVEHGNAELRELAHGMLPSALTRGGLRAGLGAVVARLDLPVQVDVPDERFPGEIEQSAYFVVAEALTNVAKHSQADRADVMAFQEDGILHVEVRDDGIGGADPSGHGLVGMADRVTALGGGLKVESPAGGGTLLTVTLPLSSD